MGTFRDLLVYQKAFDQALSIHQITENFDTRERYSLVDQIRRSSRSVCASISEAYRKRQYEAYFVNKVADADMENTETQVWLDFSLALKYIVQEKYDELMQKSEEIGKLLNHMINNPASYRGSIPLSKK